MKISIVVHRMDSLGGVQVHVKDLCEELRSRGYGVSIITGTAGLVSNPLEKIGVEIKECPGINMLNIRRPLEHIKGVFALTSRLKEVAPDIVHSHGIYTEFPSRIAARVLKIPNVHTVHGWSFGHGHSLKSRIVSGAFHGVSSLFNNGSHIFVSNKDRNHGLERGYIRRENSVTIHNGIPDIGACNLKGGGAVDKQVKLVMVSRFSNEKDHPTVLRALAKIKNLNWSMDFAGGGDSSKVREVASSLGISSRCRFLGQHADIPYLLSKKDVFVLASHNEGLPLSIIEAMRSGLPVVASDVGGVSEQVEDGVSGYTVKRMDDDALADRLGKLIVSSDERVAMGAVGRQAYEDKFSINKMMSKTCRVYDKTVELHHSAPHVPRPRFLKCNVS